jgi:magnesium-transporting ATPase (P-type)
VPSGASPSFGFIRNALAGGVLCSKCSLGKNGGKEGEIGNPTKISILCASYFVNINIETMKSESCILAKVPFSSEYKFMATVHEPNMANNGNGYTGKYVAHVKGAPGQMIEMCKYHAKAGILGEEHQEPVNMQYWTEKIAILLSHGLWVLALCHRAIETTEIKQGEALKPEFVSVCEPWLMDPPCPECVDAIAQAHKAGVRVAMITGDHKDTALAIGTQLGLVDQKYSEAITGPELDAMSDKELRRTIQK